MAYQPTDPNRPPLSEDEMRRQAPLDNELQPDPMLRESAQNGPKVAIFVVAIAVVLGALFYGLNRAGTNEASTEPGSRTAQTQPASPPAGMRGVRCDAATGESRVHAAGCADATVPPFVYPLPPRYLAHARSLHAAAAAHP